jgi:exopolysaccharide biosynthesis WecB/TagA/CpsF family protein
VRAGRRRGAADLPVRQHGGRAGRRITPAERDAVAAEVRASGAALAFVALGCPRQEVFAFEMRERLGMPLLAVGAAFPFHAGKLSQAPKFYQDRGLEWFYRLASEPRRLWRRYLLLNPLYLTLVLGQLSNVRITDPDRTPAPAGDLLYG